MNSTAKRLAELGKSDAILSAQQNKLLIKLNDTHLALEANRKERCDLLTAAATTQGPALGLAADVIATATEPKEP